MPPRDLRTLVDCDCKAIVYSDDSGVDLQYCALHGAAEPLRDAAQAAAEFIVGHSTEPAKAVYDRLMAALAQAEGAE